MNNVPEKHNETDPPPQFAMRSLMIWVAVLSGVMAVVSQVSFPTAVATVFALVLVGAHVVGNVLGTGRRDESDKRHYNNRLRRASSAGDIGLNWRQRAMLPPPTELRDHLPLGRLVPVATITGALLAAALMAVISFGHWSQAGIGGALIIELSAAVMGALAGFFTCRLAATLRRTLIQAIKE